MIEERQCEWCNRPLVNKRSDAKYCTERCGNSARNHRWIRTDRGRDARRISGRKSTTLKTERYRSDPLFRTSVLEKNLQYRRSHPSFQEKTRLAGRINYKNNPQPYKDRAKERIHLLRGNGPGISQRDWDRLVKRYNSRCAYCGEKCEPTVDHVIPVSRGGAHSIGNVVPACLFCNLSKHNKLPIEFRAWKMNICQKSG